MADAAVYMYLVGFSTSAGVATVFFISLSLYKRMQNRKPTKKTKGRVA